MFTARANYSSSQNGEITFGNNIKLQIQKPDPDLGDITKGFAEKVMWSDEEGNFYIHWKVTVPTKNGSGGKVDIRDVLTQGYLPSSFDPDNSNGPVSITRYDAAGTKKPLTTDELIERSQLPAARVMASLTLLEIRGVVRCGHDKRVSLAGAESS